MTLFEVPGWSVTGEPVPDSPSRSKKRKRFSNDSSDKGHLPDLNIDKLVKRLKGHKSDHGASSPGSGKKDKKEQLKEQEREEKKKSISLPKPLKSATQEQSKSSTAARLKHRKTRSSVESAPAALQSSAGGEALTTMQKSMKQSLDGAKFRVINETLYKSPSNEAREMMRDSRVFEEYHTGFRHQVQSWPTNPVKHYISLLSKYPVRTLIADLGCGDAALAKALAPLGIKVLSYDFVSDDAFVVEADICTRLPLPGSEGAEGEKTNGEGQIVDVVVCSLSLMGTNWPNSLREAWRVLKPNGELFVAEVASRFTNVDQFLSLVGSIGFKLKSKRDKQDESNTHFTLFEFKKIVRQKPSEKEWTKVLGKATILKPCEYKRR
ncbi:methyltransferase-domain-containing protein [Amanita rubescens]|nr:methyltransferase-domain-containing protein [Amanita rubescens]